VHVAELTQVRLRGSAGRSYPIGTIESVYGYFGLHLSGAAADAMRASWDGGPAREVASPHSYRMADFGLSAGQVDERFAVYLQSLPRRR
jgi:hypothetical protein